MGGAYDPNKAQKQKAPNYKIGSEPRGKVKYSDVPGPGNYYGPVKNKKAAPEYSMGGKYRQPAKDDFPAPGNYEPKYSNQKSAPSFSMRPKTAVPKDTTSKPAPNNYTPNYNLARE